MVLKWLRRKGDEILGPPRQSRQAGTASPGPAGKMPFYHQFPNLVRPVPPPEGILEEWDLYRPMLYLKDSSHVTLDRFREGVFISGITGSGKTSGPLYTLARLFLDYQFGALILTVKPKVDREFWLRVVKQAGRENDLVIIGPEENNYFNFFEYELSRHGGNDTRNIINLLVQLSEGRQRSGERTNDKFWKAQFDLILEKAITLLQIAGEQVTFDNIFGVINSAPRESDLTSEEAKSRWEKQNGLTRYCIASAMDRRETALDQLDRGEPPIISETMIDDLPSIIDYWLKQYPYYDDRTKGNIEAELIGTLNPFRSGKVRDILNSKRYNTTITPESVLRGKIVLVDFPVEEYYTTGEMIQFVFSLMVQRALLRRKPSKKNRPVALFGDEFHAHLTIYDHKTQATIRERGGIRVVACQNLPMFYAELGESRKAMVNAFLGNMALKFFGRNTCPITNEWASGAFDKDYVFVNSTSASSNPEKEGLSHSHSRREEQRARVKSIEFQGLRDGGPLNHNLVETIVHNKGDTFPETDNNAIVATWIQSYTFE